MFVPTRVPFMAIACVASSTRDYSSVYSMPQENVVHEAT